MGATKAKRDLGETLQQSRKMTISPKSARRWLAVARNTRKANASMRPPQGLRREAREARLKLAAAQAQTEAARARASVAEERAKASAAEVAVHCRRFA